MCLFKKYIYFFLPWKWKQIQLVLVSFCGYWEKNDPLWQPISCRNRRTEARRWENLTFEWPCKPSQREEPTLIGRGFTKPGCEMWICFTHVALSRRCSAFKAQTRRGSVFQAAEVVMKVGRSRGGVSVSAGLLSSGCRRSCKLTNQ